MKYNPVIDDFHISMAYYVSLEYRDIYISNRDTKPGLFKVSILTDSGYLDLLGIWEEGCLNLYRSLVYNIDGSLV